MVVFIGIPRFVFHLCLFGFAISCSHGNAIGLSLCDFILNC